MIEMMNVLSTYRILMKKALDQSIDESWVDWALEMMEAGYESMNLYMLAGVTRPYNQFELREWTDNVLADFGLSVADSALTIRNYVYYLISATIDEPGKYLSALREISDICIDLNMDPEYLDFYLLYFAKKDLTDSLNQWHWKGADRDNINMIIRDKFRQYLDSFQESGPVVK